MGQSMASYYNPSAAYGSLSAASMAAAAAAAQQTAAMSASLGSSSQVNTNCTALVCRLEANWGRMIMRANEIFQKSSLVVASIEGASGTIGKIQIRLTFIAFIFAH